ncbi:MAG: M48 family metallopeptidase [Anaerolineae bacterium]|nr:M48 family metallopeptidase [Anaerolineae bacterium]
MRLEILRSKRRKKTVAARIVGDTLQVRAPADLSEGELSQVISRLRPRLEREQRRRLAASSQELAARASFLNRRFFGGRLSLGRVVYVSNQRRRFGSCSPSSSEIRISERVAAMPRWVRDYVLVHEMAHLEEPNHSRRFWDLVRRYPHAERARGYLLGVAMGEAMRRHGA